jgi:hypothetical protein
VRGMRRPRRDARPRWQRELDTTVSALTGNAWMASKPVTSSGGSRWPDKGSFSPGGGGWGLYPESPQPDYEYPISENPFDPGGGGDGGGGDDGDDDTEPPAEDDYPVFAEGEDCCEVLFDADGEVSGMDCSACGEDTGDSGDTDTGAAGFFDPWGTDDNCGPFGLRC